MSDEESSDEDYDFHANTNELQGEDAEARYPIHDCCEFEDVEALKDLLYIPVDEDDDDDDDDDDSSDDDEALPDVAKDDDGVKLSKADATSWNAPVLPHVEDNQSTSDDNDSTAAAHAAAIGHSPQPIKPALTSDAFVSQIVEGNLESDQMHVNAESVKGDVATGVAKNSIITNNQAMTVDVTSNHVQNNEIFPSLPLQHVLESEPDVNTDTGTAMEVSMDIVESTINTSSDKVSSERKVTENVTETEHQGTNIQIVPKSNGLQSNLPCVKKTRKLELDRALTINERDDDENTALHIAIVALKLDQVKVLLEAGASHRIRCDGSLPVHTAISVGALPANRQFAYECLVALHDHGADLTVKDDAVHTPLYLACMFNLPQIVTYILSDEEGLSTLNVRADRAGNRPLHAASKFDTLDNPSFGKAAASIATGQVQPNLTLNHDRSQTGVDAAVIRHSITGLSGKHGPTNISKQGNVESDRVVSSTNALLTQVLLGNSGIEIDALNVLGQTPLHIACARRNWPVARLLIQAGANTKIEDRRGHTPGHLCYKRAMPIPNDLIDVLGDPPETGIVPPSREFIVDPDASTLLIHHELCMQHHTCPPILRGFEEPPPENIRRLHVLVNPYTGILRSGEFSSLVWNNEARRASIADVLKVHDYSYVERVSMVTQSIPDHSNAIAHLDGDTAISRWSFEAALRAAGALCEAVDRVVAGDNIRNAFCAVRPPGHHAGPRGIVRCANDPEGGSHGFCLLNNVCIGAAYARSMYRNEGIRKVAIIDFDVHHGNGTEAIIRNLVPGVENASIRTPFAIGELSSSTYRPWLDETDIQNVFFASTHGYGNRGFDQPGWFYPSSGKTHTSEAITHPSMVEVPNTADFILSQTWTRMGEESKQNCCKIINVGLELPEPEADMQSRNVRQRLELRDTYRKTILPALRDFDPDLIFISAGFDAHRKDTMNFGYVGMVEDDYEWVTEQLIKIANTCCSGRVVSVLEGGYKIHGGIVSPFARSVASHVRALVDGGRSRELYDPDGVEWEGQFERHLYERRERKREQEREELNRIADETKRTYRLAQVQGVDVNGNPEDPDAPVGRKRRRNQVDYKELFKQMQQEGFAA